MDLLRGGRCSICGFVHMSQDCPKNPKSNQFKINDLKDKLQKNTILFKHLKNNLIQLCSDIINIVEKEYKKEDIQRAYEFALHLDKKYNR